VQLNVHVKCFIWTGKLNGVTAYYWLTTGWTLIDQDIDTDTTTGRLILNELVCIAEFESELRAERQREGIEKAKENNVKFGRPQKTDEAHWASKRSRRAEGAPIGVLVKEFKSNDNFPSTCSEWGGECKSDKQ